MFIVDFDDASTFESIVCCFLSGKSLLEAAILGDFGDMCTIHKFIVCQWCSKCGSLAFDWDGFGACVGERIV